MALPFLPALMAAGKAALPAVGKTLASVGISKGLGALGNLFGGGDDIELQDLRTPEQIANAKFLSQLGLTGSAGGLTLGEPYGGELGDYQLTPGSERALGGLEALLGGPYLTQAGETFKSLAETTFDPSDPKTGFAAYRRQLDRARGRSSDVLEREAAVQGRRYGSRILGEKADLAERFMDIEESALAQLYKDTLQQRLAGARGLMDIEQQKAGVLQNLFAGHDIQRQLNTMKAQDLYGEFKRQRGEQLIRPEIAQVEASRHPYLGISSIPQEGMFSKFASSILKPVGESIAGDIGNIFTKGSSSGTTPTNLLFNIFRQKTPTGFPQYTPPRNYPGTPYFK